jgi:hypothetical protein
MLVLFVVSSLRVRLLTKYVHVVAVETTGSVPVVLKTVETTIAKEGIVH